MTEVKALTRLLNELRRLKSKPEAHVHDRRVKVCAVVAKLRLLSDAGVTHTQ